MPQKKRNNNNIQAIMDKIIWGVLKKTQGEIKLEIKFLRR
jgi:hypothetical protein